MIVASPPAALFDRKVFFDDVRSSLFDNRLTQHEVAGMEAIIDAFEAASLADLRWLAAILAEVYGETGKPMWPIREGGLGHGHPYGRPGRNRGQIAYGRGFDQCTWDDNYERTDHDLHLGGALIADYDLLLEPKLSARAIVTGMVSGRYRRFKLGDYLNDHMTDWVHCRLIINPDKRGPELAIKAQHFHQALVAGARKLAPVPDAAPIAPAAPFPHIVAVAPVARPQPATPAPSTKTKEEPMEKDILAGIISTLGGSAFSAAKYAAVPNLVSGAVRSVGDITKAKQDIEALAGAVRGGKWGEVIGDVGPILNDAVKIIGNFGVVVPGLGEIADKFSDWPSAQGAAALTAAASA